MISEAAIELKIADDLAAEVCNHDPHADPAKVANKVANLFAEINRRDKARRGVVITDEIIQRRLDCLIFFDLALLGWGKAKRLPSGSVVAVDSPISFDERRAFPTRYRLWTASKRVRQTCPDEAARYKQSWRAWREARKRYLATETDESWQWYRAGQGNRNSVAYRTRVDFRRGAEEYFRTRRLLKYTLGELLPRQEERERARLELRQASDIMHETRERIFEMMGVPPALRP